MVIMRINHVIILLSTVLIGLSGCGRSDVDKRLLDVESIITDKPDSALSLLNRIEPSELKNDASKAKYALLLTRAQDLCYIDIQDDSVISVARNYYSKNGPKESEMLAEYYYGRILRNAGKYGQSIVSLSKASEMAEELEDYHYMALSERNIAVLNSTVIDDRTAEKHLQKSIAGFTAAGERYYADYSRYLLAACELNLGQYEACEMMLDSLIKEYPETESLGGTVRLQYASLLLFKEHPEPDVALKIMRSFGASGQRYDLLQAYAFALKGVSDSSLFYLDRYFPLSDDPRGIAMVNFVLQKVSADKEDYEHAFRFLERSVAIQDSLTRIMLGNSITAAERDYYDGIAKEQTLNAEIQSQKRYKTIVLATALALFLILITALLLNKIRRQNADVVLLKDEIDSKKEELAVLRENLIEIESNNSESLSIVAKMILERVNLIENVLSKIDSLDVPLFNQKRMSSYDYIEYLRNVLKDYHTGMSSIINDKSYAVGLEPALDIVKDGLMSKLRKVFGNTISQDDYVMLALLFSGLTPANTGKVTGIKPSTVRTKKVRYIQRFKDLPDGPDKELFLSAFGL